MPLWGPSWILPQMLLTLSDSLGWPFYCGTVNMLSLGVPYEYNFNCAAVMKHVANHSCLKWQIAVCFHYLVKRIKKASFFVTLISFVVFFEKKILKTHQHVQQNLCIFSMKHGPVMKTIFFWKNQYLQKSKF